MRLIGPRGTAALTLTVDGEGRYQLDPETGVVTFTPIPGFAGTATVSYSITDQYGQHGTGSYEATVQAPPPATAADLATSGVGIQPQSQTPVIPAGAAITLLNGGGHPVTSLIVAGQGTYTINAATAAITFVPILGFSGAATPVAYRVTDAYGQQSQGTYRATVTAPAPGDAPAWSSSGGAGNPQSQTPPLPPGGSVWLVDGNGQSTHTLQIEGVGSYQLDPSSGVVTFTPLALFSGTPPAVRYRIIDAYGQASEGTYTPTVTIGPPVPGDRGSVRTPPEPTRTHVPCASRRKVTMNWIVRRTPAQHLRNRQRPTHSVAARQRTEDHDRHARAVCVNCEGHRHRRHDLRTEDQHHADLPDLHTAPDRSAASDAATALTQHSRSTERRTHHPNRMMVHYWDSSVAVVRPAALAQLQACGVE